MTSVRINDFYHKHSSETFVAIEGSWAGNKYYIIACPQYPSIKKNKEPLQQKCKINSITKAEKKIWAKYGTNYHQSWILPVSSDHETCVKQ